MSEQQPDPRLPSVSFRPIEGGREMTVVDPTHPQGVSTPIMDGVPGAPGRDGVSPSVSVTDIPGGHRVTFTDKAHAEGLSFDVPDGPAGRPGQDLTRSTVIPVESSASRLEAGPGRCYDWTASGDCELRLTGWSLLGEEWSTVYLRLQPDSSVTVTGQGELLCNLEPGKVNRLLLIGYRGSVRIKAMDIY